MILYVRLNRAVSLVVSKSMTRRGTMPQALSSYGAFLGPEQNGSTCHDCVCQNHIHQSGAASQSSSSTSGDLRCSCDARHRRRMQEDLTSRQPRSRICNIEFRLHKPLCCYVRLQAFQSIDSDLVGPSASWLHIRMAAEPKGGEISLDVDVFRTDIGSMGFEIHDFALDELPSFQASGRVTFVIGLEEAEAAARMTGNGDVEGDFGPVGKDFRWGNSEAGLVSGESRVRGVTYVWVL